MSGEGESFGSVVMPNNSVFLRGHWWRKVRVRGRAAISTEGTPGGITPARACEAEVVAPGELR